MQDIEKNKQHSATGNKSCIYFRTFMAFLGVVISVK